jgi:hypothetical protein
MMVAECRILWICVRFMRSYIIKFMVSEVTLEEDGMDLAAAWYVGRC